MLSAACRIGGLVAEAPTDHVDALSTFGRSYGMAFQVVDDVLDLVSTEAALGKPAGHDLQEGVYTLPVLYSLDGPDGNELRELLSFPLDEPTRHKALAIVRDGEGIPRSIEAARGYAAEGRDALGELPPSTGVIGLTAAADYLLDTVETAAA